jgi:hypothetical protein
MTSMAIIGAGQTGASATLGIGEAGCGGDPLQRSFTTQPEA